jgi:hypothetical protein
MCLELGDLARHRRNGDAQAFGGTSEAACLNDPGKGADGVKAIHGQIIAYCATVIQSTASLSN